MDTRMLLHPIPVSGTAGQSLGEGGVGRLEWWNPESLSCYHRKIWE